MINITSSVLATISPKEPTKQPSRQIAGLADLPNELINNLLRDLQAETLCHLAMTCKRLHYVALPVIFYRAGIDPSSKHLLLREPSEDFLRALRLALFVDPTTVDFYPNRKVDRMFPDLCTLRLLITRMPNVERLTLNLSWFDSWLESARGPDKFDADRWKEEMCELLDNVLLTTCNTLKVLGGNRIATLDILDSQRSDDPTLSRPNMTRKHSSPDSFHRKSFSKAQRVNPTIPCSSLPTSGAPLSSKPTHSLQRLYLHCQMLFEPPFLSWTQLALRAHAASITHFSIKAILHREIWKSIFDGLSLPNLSKLEYLSDLKLHPWPIGLEFATMAAFVARHPSITILNLYGILERPTKREPPLRKAILPALVEIKAHPTFIAWLLRPTGACRNLSKVTISSELYPVTPFDYNLFDDALVAIAHRSKGIQLGFQFTLKPGAERWMEAHVSQGHMLSIVTNLHIKNLGIHSNYWLIIFRDMPAVFADFLALFPCLDHVDFVDERACPAEVERVKATVIKQIALKCPGMKTVAIDSEPGSPFVDLMTLRN